MSNLLVERLKQSPWRSAKIWQEGFVRLPAWVKGEQGIPLRPWTPLRISRRTGKVQPGLDVRPAMGNAGSPARPDRCKFLAIR